MCAYREPITLTKDRELVERYNKVVAPCNHLTYFPLVVDKYKGAIITDIDGNEFIDFLSSASSMNLGGQDPDITAAAHSQLDKAAQYSTVYTYNEPVVEYAERLVSVFPGGCPAKIAFGNMGSDANDAAIKFARAYTGRMKIISFINSYHGNTFGSSSLSSVTTRMNKSMGPFLPEMYAFPFSNCCHCIFDKDPNVCAAECLRPIDNAFSHYIDPYEVAAIIIEPIQGDGGIVAAHKLFIEGLYERCRKYGILFIVEEVQQGFGRTGKFFSIENYNIVPDGIIIGKSIGAGFTMGAFMAKTEIMDCLPAPAHAFTLGGNHIASAAGCASFDKITSPGFLDEVVKKGNYIKDKFASLKEKYNIIGEIRGWGMSIGVEIVKGSGSKEGDVIGTSKMCYRAYEKGLVMISLAGNVFRVQPPLIISYEEIDKALNIIDETMGEYVNDQIPDEVLENCKGW